MSSINSSSVGPPASGGFSAHGAADIIKDGYLKKQKTNKKKFFVLRGPLTLETANLYPQNHPQNRSQDARLEYYESEQQFRKGKQPKRIISLSSTVIIQKKDEVGTGRGGVSPFSYGINLILPSSTTNFAIVAETKQEQDSWIAALNDVQGMSVHSTERFRHTWEVNVLNRGLGTKRNLRGPSFLSLTETHVYLRRAEAGTDMEISFPLQYIRRCSCATRYFQFECGRQCPFGEGEIWISAEDDTIAQSIKETVFSAMQQCGHHASSDLRPRSRSSSQNEPSTSATSTLATFWGGGDPGQKSGTLPNTSRTSRILSGIIGTAPEPRSHASAPPAPSGSRSRTISDGAVASPQVRRDKSSPGRSATSTALSSLAVVTAGGTVYSRSISVPAQAGLQVVHGGSTTMVPSTTGMSTSVSSNLSIDMSTGSSVDDFDASPREHPFHSSGNSESDTGYVPVASGSGLLTYYPDPRSLTPESPRGVIPITSRGSVHHPGISEEPDNYIDMHPCSADDGSYMPMTGSGGTGSTGMIPVLITGKPPIGPLGVSTLNTFLPPGGSSSTGSSSLMSPPISTTAASSDFNLVQRPPSSYAGFLDQNKTPLLGAILQQNTSFGSHTSLGNIQSLQYPPFSRVHQISTSSTEDDGGYMEMSPPSRGGRPPPGLNDDGYVNMGPSRGGARAQGVRGPPSSSPSTPASNVERSIEEPGYVAMNPPTSKQDLEDSEYVPMLPPAVVDSTTAPILITSAPRTPASMGIPVPAVSLGHSHRRATPPSAGNQVLRMTPPPAGLNTSVSSSPGSTSSIGGTFYPRGSSGSNTLLASPPSGILHSTSSRSGEDESDYMEMNMTGLSSGGSSGTTPPSAGTVKKKSASPSSAGAEGKGK